MKPISAFLLLFLLISVSSCDVVVGIFEAGFWAGIILVIIVVVLIFFIIKKLRKP